MTMAGSPDPHLRHIETSKDACVGSSTNIVAIGYGRRPVAARFQISEVARTCRNNQYWEGERGATETNLRLKDQSKVSKVSVLRRQEVGELRISHFVASSDSLFGLPHVSNPTTTRPITTLTTFGTAKKSSKRYNKVVEIRPSIARRILGSPHSMRSRGELLRSRLLGTLAVATPRDDTRELHRQGVGQLGHTNAAGGVVVEGFSEGEKIRRRSTGASRSHHTPDTQSHHQSRSKMD
ncbi:hypothetical protein BKA64DRAFT_641288 [Cadophora sp. MPI-SDFR-AT-0126]|nr:hypothetical protein BKA64DRAFT_641288 [Leotiomycetes sp. MPI-SDFR-AT-0126]